MKFGISFFLFLLCIVGYSQETKSAQFDSIKQEILLSKEVLDWQHATIAFQKSNLDFCSLKNEQQLNQALFISCGKPGISESYKEYTLRLFRTMRITNELEDTVMLKEKALRTRFPQLATHFEFDDIFPELYAPIQRARVNY